MKANQSYPNLKMRLVTGRLVFAFIFLCLMVRFCLNATPSGMLQPVLYRYNFDFTYWFFDLTGIFQMVIHSPAGSIVFDVLLFLFCLLCLLFPLKHYYAIVFFFLFLVYFTSFNAFIVHHTHPLALMTLMIVPFCFKSALHWKLMWEGLRYYVCYAYFISFVWKALIGKSLLFWNMGFLSAQANLVEYLYHYPHTWMSAAFRFFTSHPFLLNGGLIFVFLLEGVMVVGFITKKYDRFLLLIPLVVHLSTYLFSDVYFIEMLVGMFTFLSCRALCRLGSTFPQLEKTVNGVLKNNHAVSLPPKGK